MARTPRAICERLIASAQFQDAARAAGEAAWYGKSSPLNPSPQGGTVNLAMSREHGTYWGSP